MDYTKYRLRREYIERKTECLALIMYRQEPCIKYLLKLRNFGYTQFSL